MGTEENCLRMLLIEKDLLGKVFCGAVTGATIQYRDNMKAGGNITVSGGGFGFLFSSEHKDVFLDACMLNL